MARVKFGAIVSDISGSVGGLVFQRSQYGNSLRTKPFPSPNYSDSSFNRKAALLKLQFIWRYMNDEQKRAYQTFMSFRPTYVRRNASSLLSGYNLFLKYGLVAMAAGQVPQTSIKFNIPELNLGSPFLEKVGTEFYLNIGTNLPASNFDMLCLFSKSFSRNTFIADSQLRVVPTQSFSGNRVKFTYPYSQRYLNLPQIGDWVLCRYTVFSLDSPVIYPTFKGVLEVKAGV